MNQLYFTLRRGSTEIFTSHAILRITSNDIQIKKEDFEGMKVQRRRLTPFYQLEVMLGIESDEIKSAADLGIADSLVLTMQSSGYQPEMAARLYPYWEAALKDGGTDRVVVTGVRAIPKDYRRLI